MAVSMIGPKIYCWDRNGKPLAFGKLYTYQARTNDPKDTYQSEDQIVPNTNPVILNGEGYANVYLSGSYKMVLKDKDENEIWSSDPVSAAQPDEWVKCLSTIYISSTSLKVNGNFVSDYSAGRRVRIDNNTSEYSYSTVESSTFAAGETTIVISDPVITTGVVEICASIVGVESFSSGNVLNFEFINDAVTSKLLREGDSTNVKELTSGSGKGAMFDAVDINSVTTDGKDILACSGVTSLALVKRYNWDDDQLDTVDELKQSNIKEGLIVRTKGYYSKGDGGEGKYLISNSDPGDSGFGNHSLNNGKFAILQISDLINVKQFGAKGDGVADDYAPIQAACNYADSLGGGTIVCPKTVGGYMLWQSVYIRDFVTFDGQDNIFLTDNINGSYDSSGALIMAGYLTSQTEPAEPAEKMRITRCRYDGNDTPRTFYLGFAKDSTIDYCQVFNASNPFFVRRGFGNRILNNYAKDTVFQMVGTGGADDLADRTGTLEVRGNVAQGVGNLAFDVRTLSHVILTNNIVLDAVGILKNQEEGSFTFSNNYCEMNASATSGNFGVKIDADYCIVANNRFISQGDAPIIYIRSFNNAINKTIVEGNFITSEGNFSGVVRFDGTIGINKTILKGNYIASNSNDFYTIKQESTVPMDELIIEGNIIYHGETQTATGTRSAIVLRDITNSKIINNSITVNKDLSGAVDNKAIWTLGSADKLLVSGNNIIAGTNGGANVTIDLRGGSVTNCIVRDNISNGINASPNQIQVEPGNNNLLFLNLINDIYEDTTPNVVP